MEDSAKLQYYKRRVYALEKFLKDFIESESDVIQEHQNYKTRAEKLLQKHPDKPPEPK